MTITISEPCLHCGKEVTITIPITAFMSWKSGTLSQDIMPNLSIFKREFLILNLCPACQDEVFTSSPDDKE